MAMENQLARRSGASPREEGRSNASLPRVSGGGDGDDNEDEKIYYGFGVFMGLPLADLKAMKEDFVEQQARNGGPPRRALPSSAVVDGRAHRVEDDEAPYERQDERMGAPMSRASANGYQREDGRQYAQEGSRYAAQRGESAADDEDTQSDGSDAAQKSHSLNFILH